MALVSVVAQGVKVIIKVRSTVGTKKALKRFMAENDLADYDAALIQLLKEKGYIQQRVSF